MFSDTIGKRTTAKTEHVDNGRSCQDGRWAGYSPRLSHKNPDGSCSINVIPHPLIQNWHICKGRPPPLHDLPRRAEGLLNSADPNRAVQFAQGLCGVQGAVGDQVLQPAVPKLPLVPMDEPADSARSRTPTTARTPISPSTSWSASSSTACPKTSPLCH